MTPNTVISGQTVGVSNIGEGLFPWKVTIASTTTAFVITADLTNNSGGSYDQAQHIEARFISSPVSLTAAQAYAYMQRGARYLTIIPAHRAGDRTIVSSEVEVCNGGYIYGWMNIPKANLTQTLSVYCVELP